MPPEIKLLQTDEEKKAGRVDYPHRHPSQHKLEVDESKSREDLKEGKNESNNDRKNTS